MNVALLKSLNALRARRQAAILTTDVKTGAQQLFERGAAPQDGALREELAARFLSGKSGAVDDVFFAVYLPPPRLVIIGAVHISQHMIGPAQAAGFDVTVIDPRTAFASEDRFPGVALHAEWPDEILRDQPLDAYTALAALTHDPKIDDGPLKAAFEAECFYIGALGSRKTHAQRVARLVEAGVSEEALSRMDAPIGLDIGAASPAE
ncbi:MAG: XdhC family protein, partial [Pseudomonadota bacterium]